MNDGNDERKGHATAMFSREELMLIEYCITNTMQRGQLDEDAIEDATVLLQEIRRLLGNDANSITERLGEKLRAALHER